ncbi:hypothetical protein HPB50_009723 [Hyalomma asiaticum]|uniref:Uncharacterized protein n=1 Tax=Hyalomma asiaticum TaxID=266040 RepID=A0ACB7TFJ2_HYAAI|nr:hypothetical protein HPB50_009723 [Hyalomma asiaticum]
MDGSHRLKPFVIGRPKKPRCFINQYIMFSAMKMAHAPPGHHSVIGRPSVGGLSYPEYVVYRGEQAYPEYLISYQIEKPQDHVVLSS